MNSKRRSGIPPTLFAALCLVVCAGPWWLAVGRWAFAKNNAYEERQRREGVEFVERMLADGRARVEQRTNHQLELVMHYQDAWEPNAGRPPDAMDITPLKLLAYIGNWADAKRFTVQSGGVELPASSQIGTVAFDYERTIKGSGLKNVSDIDIKEANGQFARFNITVTRSGPASLTVRASATDNTQGVLVNDCHREACNALWQCAPLRLCTDLSITESYCLRVMIVLQV